MYEIWRAIKRRCGLLTYGKDSEKFLTYRKKGITMCPEWADSLEKFMEDMGPRESRAFSVDRIDNNKGYYKENCKWSTKKEQMNNRENNRFVEYNGKRQTIQQWAEELNLDWKLLKGRLDRLFTGLEAVGLRGQSIVQKAKDGSVIKHYKTVEEATLETGISQAALRKCLCKHNNSSGGYLWEYS